jgi:hypothetical protein
LYLEVLKTAFERLTTDAGFDPEKLKSLSREQAVRSFLRASHCGRYYSVTI